MDFCCAICRNIVLETAATNLVTCTDLNTESCFTMLFICVVLQKSFKHQVRVACKWDWAILYQCPLTYYWSVREITKVSNTFSATNINSNIEWLFQLHDIIQMKSNYTWINYNHDSIATRSHIMIYNCAWNLIFGINFSCISLTKGEKRLFLLTCIVRRYSYVWCKIWMCDCCINLIKSHAWYHTSLINFPNECLPCDKKILPNLEAKMKFYTSFYIIKWHLLTMLYWIRA